MPPNSSTNNSSPSSVRMMDPVELGTHSTETVVNSPDEATEELRSRSVKDFDTEQGLREALKDNRRRSAFLNTLSGSCNALATPLVHDDEDDALSATSSSLDTSLDWVTENLCTETSHPQTLEGELNRLKVLRSYLILDADREASFERLTGMASRVFNVPICVVSLVDLGRQWFMSNRGLGDVRETPRKLAFCAHTIMTKNDLLIVEDATKDNRFKNNVLVTSAPHVRFYAGAPLICPEGYKLGTLCLIDLKTRPGGLSLDEKQNLKELAAMVVDSMVQRRRNKMQDNKDWNNLVACTAHDMLTPLNGVQLSLNLLKDDENSKSLSKSQLELLDTASSCCDVMSKICQRAVDSYRREGPASTQSLSSSKGTKEIKIDDFVKNVQLVMEPYPKSVPLVFSLDPAVPPVVVSDDLKVFRSAINLLTNACRKTRKGSVEFKISVKKHKPNEEARKLELCFECFDSGPGIRVERYPFLFNKPAAGESDTETDYEEASACVNIDPVTKKLSGGVCRAIVKNESGLGLYSVANSIGSIGGDYGFRPNDAKGGGSVFWFSIPLKAQARSDPPNGIRVQEICATSTHSIPVVISTRSDGSSSDGPSNQDEPMETSKRSSLPQALVIDDSQVIRKSVSRALTKLGFEVRSAVNGMEGFREMQQSVFDVVLCDFLMPVMDGLDCVQQYREWEAAHRPLYRQHIVGISAHANADDSERGLKAGMDAFLPKPVTFKTLKKLKEDLELQSKNESLHSVVEGSDLIAPAPTIERNGNKKRRLNLASKASKGPVCLVADHGPSSLARAVEEQGWKTCVVQSGEDALRLLRMRRWDAVFLNEDMEQLSAVRCMERFRAWENEYRVARQSNIVLLTNSDLPCPSTTIGAVLPNGFDGAIGKPTRLTDLNFLLKKALQSRTNHEILSR